MANSSNGSSNGDSDQKNLGGLGRRDPRSRELLGAAFLYVLISIAYGVWIVTHGGGSAHLTAQSGVSFVEVCLTWPSLISIELRSIISRL